MICYPDRNGARIGRESRQARAVCVPHQLKRSCLSNNDVTPSPRCTLPSTPDRTCWPDGRLPEGKIVCVVNGLRAGAGKSGGSEGYSGSAPQNEIGISRSRGGAANISPAHPVPQNSAVLLLQTASIVPFRQLSGRKGTIDDRSNSGSSIGRGEVESSAGWPRIGPPAVPRGEFFLTSGDFEMRAAA